MGSTRKGRDIDSALRRKGFNRNVSADHIFYHFGNTKIGTKMSHGMMSSSLGAKLIGEMARQLHLSKTQFLALVDCTMNADEYWAIVGEPS